MTADQIAKLQPYLILAGTPLVTMLIVAVKRNHLLTLFVSLIGLLLSLFSASYLRPLSATPVGELLIVDNYALFYFSLQVIATFFILIFSYRYLELRFKGNKEEYYLLMVTATLGSVVLAASTHFVSFFLGLEILSVSLYGLIAYLRQTEEGIEAGLKYLVLAAVSSAFLVFGMALLYALSGHMDFSGLIDFLSHSTNYNVLAIAGLVLVVVGFGFKLALVPFHMWSPDVYEGAPAPVSGFIASVSKAGVLALLFRFFAHYNIVENQALFTIFALFAVLTMFVGNFLALLQPNVKRMLAYSSIAHFGYILVAFLAANNAQNFKGVEAATFYIVSYFVTIIGAFAIIGILSSENEEAKQSVNFRGLYWKHPWLSIAFSAMLFSLAGIPLTAGFIGKYYVLSSGVGSGLWMLVFILIVNSALGVYYYLRVIVEMFSEQEEKHAFKPNIGLMGGVVLALLTIALIWLGIYPTGLIGAIKFSVMGL